MQKSKKISWQAIAIVALALVLVVAIALGVSGAWFQDQDSDTATATMGAPVLVKLADKTSSGDVQTWGNTYKSTTSAYPGDFLLGSTKIVAGNTSTPTIYRAKITTSVVGTGYNASATSTTLTDADNKSGTDYADTPVYTENEYNYNSYLINNVLANATTNGSDWLAGNSSEYIYYKEVSSAETIDLFANGLTLPIELTNACNGWVITITLTVEAVQAANFTSSQVPTGWDYSDIPSALASSITSYNTGRVAE